MRCFHRGHSARSPFAESVHCQFPRKEAESPMAVSKYGYKFGTHQGDLCSRFRFQEELQKFFALHDFAHQLPNKVPFK